jgi:transcription-repair coupling factor (superfamily II helicase)
VDTIRVFAPETQRSQEPVSAVRLLPAREFPLTEEAITRFRKGWRRHFEGDPSAASIYRDVSSGLAPPGIEYYLPLFFEETATLFDYLPKGCAGVVLDQVLEAAEGFWGEAGERFEQRRHDRERPLLPPGDIFLQANEVFAALGELPQVRLGHFEEAETGAVNFASRAPTGLPIDARAPDPLAAVKRFLADFDGRVLVAAETSGRRETLLENLSDFRETLSDKELDIFDNRIMSENPLTLQELGDKYGISRERVRQIQEKIVKNIKEWLSEKIPNFEEEFSNFV